MPPRRNEPQNKSTSHWKPADDIKLSNLVNQGWIDPKDRSLAAIKKLHSEEWLHKTYKSFSRLICTKLEKLHTARVIEGARKSQSQTEQEGKINWFIVFLSFTYLFLFNSSYLADDEDSSCQESEGEDISLGLQDTKIDDSEIHDLEEEVATMPTPKSHLQ